MFKQLIKGKKAQTAFMGANQLRSEIDRLADFILKEFPDEPGKLGESESAVDVAIRLLSEPIKELRSIK